MIFAPEHVEMIFAGAKTQTRRQSGKYQVGKDYAIRPCRTCSADPRGRILVMDKHVEKFPFLIAAVDAEAEGGYFPVEYEMLYVDLNGRWETRYAYTFKMMKPEGGPETRLR